MGHPQNKAERAAGIILVAGFWLYATILKLVIIFDCIRSRRKIPQSSLIAETVKCLKDERTKD
jgi:hypothetical protein